MLDLVFWSAALFAVFLGFLGWNPRVHNPTCTRRLDYAHAGLFMRVLILPRNPDLNFDDFFFFGSDFTCNASVLSPFLYIHVVKLLFHMLNYLFPFHIPELGFILYFLALMSWTCIHMFMHNAIGTKLLQGKWKKSCIHNVHAFICDMILLRFDDMIALLML